MELIIFSILFLIFVYSCYYLFTSNQKQNANNKGFKIYPIVGVLPGFLRNRHRFLDWSTETLSQCPTNTVVFVRPGKIHGVISANPLNVEHVLKTNFDNYPKGDRFRLLLQDFLGQGIFNSDGELWKIQRKTASYEFNTKSLRNFIIDNVRVETFTRLIPVLNQASKTQQVLDLQDVLEQFSFDNICKLAFNVDPGCLGKSGSEFMRAFEEAATLSYGRFMYAFPFSWKIAKFFNIGSEKKLKNSIKIVHEFAESIIKTRFEEEAKTDEDLLSMFIGSHDNSPQFMVDVPGKDKCPQHLLSLTLRIKGGLPVRNRCIKPWLEKKKDESMDSITVKIK
ncbi:Cytochrome P450 [Corchorus olitorius]|uniref:Cytochrome P450 n=1 Tax=Corchorus olitorius TaxID=93759 RepID=A0A1R3JHW4_9ROSI|nr:Cytochrome P450 [Corchorus olitorius]